MTAEVDLPLQSPLEVDLLNVGRVSVDLDSVLKRLLDVPRVRPFHESRTEFLADFARKLGKRARGQGDVQALAYWLRRTELTRLEQDFQDLDDPGSPLQPRGLVFHIPPSNVGTIFVYSLALSLLAGNANIVRMSSRALAAPNLILDVLRDSLREFPDVADSIALVSYDHDDSITACISHACDVRVIWGGDETIDRVRCSPLRPSAKDVTFADRFSLAAISTDAYIASADLECDALAERFFNDTFWFDQMGCSSPRVLIWVGSTDHAVAAEDFHSRLAEVIVRKQYLSEPAAEVSKLNMAYRSVLDIPVVSHRRYGIGTVLESTDFPDARGDFCGGGFLFQWHVGSLLDLLPHVERKDQTLSIFGVSQNDVESFVSSLAGRGIDRIVPIGEALNFGRYWDGYDLLAEFTRRTVVTYKGPIE